MRIRPGAGSFCVWSDGDFGEVVVSEWLFLSGCFWVAASEWLRADLVGRGNILNSDHAVEDFRVPRGCALVGRGNLLNSDHVLEDFRVSRGCTLVGRGNILNSDHVMEDFRVPREWILVGFVIYLESDHKNGGNREIIWSKRIHLRISTNQMLHKGENYGRKYEIRANATKNPGGSRHSRADPDIPRRIPTFPGGSRHSRTYLVWFG